MRRLSYIYTTLLSFGLIVPILLSIPSNMHILPSISPWIALGIESITLCIFMLMFCLFEREVRIRIAPISISLFSIVLSILLSSLLGSENRPEAILHPLGALTFLFFIPFVTPFVQRNESHRSPIRLSQTSFVCVAIIFSCFVLFPSSSALLLFVASILLLIPKLFFGDKRIVPITGLVLVTLVVSLLITFPRISLTQEHAAPLISTIKILYRSWNQPLSFLIGSGPDRYPAIFTANRPEELNQTQLWDSTFQTAANAFFQVATTTGILGTATLVVFIVAIGFAPFLDTNGQTKPLLKKIRDIPIISFLVVMVLIFLPPTLLSWIIAIFILQQDQQHVQLITKPLKGLLQPLFIVSYLSVLMLLGLGYVCLIQVYRAESFAMQGKTAIADRNTNEGINALTAAISILPFRTAYYHALAQTHQDIALNLLPPLPHTGDNTSWYLQQAVDAAKKETELEPHTDTAWKDLAAIYNLLSVDTPGVAAWQVAAYHTATTLDPTNAMTGISYGDVLESLGNTEAALSSYITAITLKKNSSTGYYRLARIYRKHGDYEKSSISYKQALLALPFDSPEIGIIQQELQSLPGYSPSPSSLPLVNPTPTPQWENGQYMGPEEEGFQQPETLH